MTRYINQLEHDKANMRSSRMDTELAFRVTEHRYTQLHDTSRWSTNLAPGDANDDEFDPYIEHGYPSPRHASSNGSPNHALRSHSISKNGQIPAIEEGYGGGTWTHADVTPDEKKTAEEFEKGMAYRDPFQPPGHIGSEFDIQEDDAVPLYTPRK